MANAKVTGLPAHPTPLTEEDLLVVVTDIDGTLTTTKAPISELVELIPAGEQGATGDTGPAGADGNAGAQGATGPAGTFNPISRATLSTFASRNSGGIQSLAVVGSDLGSTNAGTVSRVVADGAVWTSYATAASTTASAGVHLGASDFTQCDLDPTYEMLIRTGASLTNVRIWVGLSTTAFTNSDTQPINGAAFRFSTVTSDAGWMPCTRNATDQTVGTAIGTVAANTTYRLKIRFSDGGTNVHFSVNGGAEQTMTLTLPVSSAALGPEHRLFTQANEAKALLISRTHLAWGSTL